jgi:hypothetical protein
VVDAAAEGWEVLELSGQGEADQPDALANQVAALQTAVFAGDLAV